MMYDIIKAEYRLKRSVCLFNVFDVGWGVFGHSLSVFGPLRNNNKKEKFSRNTQLHEYYDIVQHLLIELQFRGWCFIVVDIFSILSQWRNYVSADSVITGVHNGLSPECDKSLLYIIMTLYNFLPQAMLCSRFHSMQYTNIMIFSQNS